MKRARRISCCLAVCIALLAGAAGQIASAQQPAPPLPRGVVARFGNDAFRGRCEAGVIFLPDNRTLVTDAGFCDVATGNWIRRFPEGKDQFSAILLSPRGDRFATRRREFNRSESSYSTWIDFWSPEGKHQSSWQPDESETLGAWIPDGKTVVTFDRTQVCLRDTDTGELKASRQFEKTDLKSINVSPDGDLLVVNGWMEMWFWRWKLDQPPERIPEVKRGGTGGAFSPDGRLYAADHGFFFGVSLIDVESRKIVRSLVADGATSDSANLLFSKDGSRLYAPLLDQGVAVWKVDTGELERRLPSRGTSTMSIAMSADGRWLAGGGRLAASVAVWDVATGQPVTHQAIGHRDRVSCVAFSKDGSSIASGGSDRTLRLWDPATGTERAVLSDQAGKVTRIAFAPDGRRLAALSFDDAIRIVDVDSGKLIRTLAGHGRIGGIGSILDFSDDGQLLTSVGADLRWQVQNVQTGEMVETRALAQDPTRGGKDFSTTSPQPLAIDSTASDIGLFSARGFETVNARTLERRLAVTWPEPPRRVIATEGGTMIGAIVPGKPTEVPLKNGQVRFEASQEHVLWLFDLKTGQLIRQIPLPRGFYPDCAFSPDGRCIAVACPGPRGPLLLLDAATGRELGRAEGEPVNGYCMQFSPDSSHLLTSTQLGTMTLWNIGELEIKQPEK